MSRAPLVYNRQHAYTPVEGGLQVDEPREGFYRMRVRGGTIRVGVRIWYGPPHDPVTGEEMDRSWRHQAMINDRQVDLERAWPICAKDPIDETEYRYLCELGHWIDESAPRGASQTKPINPLDAPLLF